MQSLLLWLAIAGTSISVGIRRGAKTGVALYLILIFFLRVRDASSAVMSESISTAIAIVLIASLWTLPGRRLAATVFWGMGAAALFWIRPNIGALALGAGVVLLLPQWKRTALVVVGFATLTVPVWILTAQGGDAGRGIANPILGASVDYYWSPLLPSQSHSTDREIARAKMHLAIENWKQTLSRWDADTGGQILWRTLHGFFATEFYDARWSSSYRRLDTVARTAAPLLTLVSIAGLLSFPFRGDESQWNLVALFLLLGLIAQNFLLGSHPRYVLPLLPVIILLGVSSLESLRTASRSRWAVVATLFTAGLILLGTHPGLVDWEWGRVEAAGIRLHQRIPRAALPDRTPATLHLRIAPSFLPTEARLDVFGPGSRLVYSSSEDPSRSRPDVTISIPEWLLAINRREAVDLELVSSGGYDDLHYLLFPVIPRPWGARAWREESRELSPSTGVAAGSLDWWAHRGLDPDRRSPPSPAP